MSDKRIVGAVKSAEPYHHGGLRRALIGAASTMLEGPSPDTMSLVGLAKSLGVSQGAPYRHFADRDAMLAAVAAEGFTTLGGLLAPMVTAPTEKIRLLRLGRAYVEFGVKRPGLYRLMFASNLLSRAPQGDDLKAAAQERFDHLPRALDSSATLAVRKRRALKIWVGLHGATMLAVDGLLADNPARVSTDDLVKDILA
jgi:AcrR family transcriptional regulator